MRLDPALATAAAILLSAAMPGAPLPAALVAIIGAVAFRRQLAARTLIVALAVLGIGAVRAQRTLDAFEARRVQVRDALGAPARCSVEGLVQSSPALRADSLGFLARLDRAECAGRNLPVPLMVRLYGGPEELSRGTRFSAITQLGPIRLFRNLELPDPLPRAARGQALLSGGVLALEIIDPGTGITAAVDRVRAHVRRRIERTFTPNAEAIARALVLGENDLDDADSTAFKQSGLAHVLAVSGTHLVFAVLALVQALSALLVRIPWLALRVDVRRIAAGVGVVLACGYADFAGGSGSAWRAAWMLAFAFLVRAVGAWVSVGRAVSASIVVGGIVDPLLLYDISFLLSVAATAGLVLLARPLVKRAGAFEGHAVRWIVTVAVATMASMVPCAPLLLMLSPNLTLASVGANVLAGPFGELVSLPLCLLHSVLSPLPTLEHGTALVASGALLVVKHVAHAAAGARWLAVSLPPPSPWHFALLVSGMFFGLSVWRARDLGRARSRLLKVCCIATLSGLILVELAQRAAGRPEGVLRVSQLDVGQGDSSLVDLPDGRLLLIDAGGFVGVPTDPGERVIGPLLRARRRDRVDIAILSHPHPDHFGGMRAALASVDVGEFWDTGQGRVEGAGPVYRALVEELERRGIPILGPSEVCGRHDLSGTVLDVYAPCPKFVAGRGANDNSFVIRIAHRGHAVLFTGDAERVQEAQLATRLGSRLRADLLKVGHHGSRTSSTLEFLSQVRATTALISCGVRNRFGHPHPIALSRLRAAGAHVLRLDRVGSVQWIADEQVSVRSFSENR